MADHSEIEWTDATWQIVTGCDIVSPGCTNCYAMKLAGGRLQHHPSRDGLTKDSKAGSVWTGEVRFNEAWLRQPLQWRAPRMIFVAAHGDLFHEGVQRSWLDKIFAVMALAPQHTFQVLTKRPARAARYTSGIETTQLPQQRIGRAMREISPRSPGKPTWPLPNVWIGTSVEDQARAIRLFELSDVQAAVRWASFEPLLGAVDPCNIDISMGRFDALAGQITFSSGLVREAHGIDWAVTGGESGVRARPMHPAWARNLRDNCLALGVPFFFKQWGAFRPTEAPDLPNDEYTIAWPDGSLGAGNQLQNGGLGTSLSRVGKKTAGRLLDGIEHNGMPELAR